MFALIRGAEYRGPAFVRDFSSVMLQTCQVDFNSRKGSVLAPVNF